MRCLPDKKTKPAGSPALASARIAPKICQGQLQTVYSEFPKFHPNPFTSGRVIAERMNIVETRHKVFPILSEALSPSNNVIRCFLKEGSKEFNLVEYFNNRVSGTLHTALSAQPDTAIVSLIGWNDLTWWNKDQFPERSS